MIDKNIPRPEFPNPQFKRNMWLNLNGKWEFEQDKSVSGRERKVYLKEKLDGEIIVPFCMESRLSGVGDTDFCECVWYRKEVTLGEDWVNENKRVLLFVGACDY